MYISWHKKVTRIQPVEKNTRHLSTMSIMFGCFKQEPGQVDTSKQQQWTFTFHRYRADVDHMKFPLQKTPISKKQTFFPFHSCKLLMANTLHVLLTTFTNPLPQSLPTPDLWPLTPPAITSFNVGRFSSVLTAGNDTMAGWEVTLRSKVRRRQRPQGPAAGKLSHRLAIVSFTAVALVLTACGT